VKPVLERVLDKNGEESVHFHPTARMQLFAIKKSESPGLGDGDIAKEMNIDPQLPRRWAERYGRHYLEWLEEYVESNVTGNEALVLERVGMVQAVQRNNYSFWRDMAKKHGVIKEEVKDTTHITINTDFSHIFVGADFNDARRKILDAYRGLGNKTGPGVVDVAHERLQICEGREDSGVGSMQDGPVEVVNPLGEDRGHAEQGEPVPAVPRKSTP